MGNLTAIGIKKARDGRLGDGQGLELHKKGDGGKWVWRYSFAGKRREMGLGTFPSVGLADARKERDRWALLLSTGKDPISERSAAKAAARADIEKADPTLEDLAYMVLDAKKAGLREEGKRGRWMSPLATHVFPRIGRKRVSAIHQVDVRDAVAPIWKTKHPTAEKAIQRLNIIFRHGKLMGYDCDPFTIEAAKHMLGEVHHQTESITATPWQDVPALFQALTDRGSVAACLQFMILTLVRSAGCRGARFDEISEGVWTVPPERMKGRVGKVESFRVPLSRAAMQIVDQQAMFGGEYLFASHRGRPVSDTSLSKHLNMLNVDGRPHGFRTSFRTWVQDTDATSWDVAETILAHSIGGRVERSYARSDLLERRAVVMENWAGFVTSAPGDVVDLQRSARS